LKRKFFKIWRIWVIFSMKNHLYKSKFYFGGNSPVKETLLPTLLPESHSAEHPQTDFRLIDATRSQIDYFWRRSQSQSHAPFQGSKSRDNANSS
jgi:hypothetical protein